MKITVKELNPAGEGYVCETTEGDTYGLYDEKGEGLTADEKADLLRVGTVAEVETYTTKSGKSYISKVEVVTEGSGKPQAKDDFKLTPAERACGFGATRFQGMEYNLKEEREYIGMLIDLMNE